MAKEKIKMRINNNENSICELCEEKYKYSLEMYDLCINENYFVICKDCVDKLFMKLLKADCLYQGKVKSSIDLERVKRHSNKYGFAKGYKFK